MKEGIKGFVQLPVVIVLLLGALGVGGVFVSKKLPEIKQERQAKKIVRTTLPKGASKKTEVLVGFRKPVSPQVIDKVHKTQNFEVKKRLSKIKVDVVKVPADLPFDEVRRRYKAFSEVEFVEPNFLAQSLLVPNDPLYQKQWGLKKIESEKAFEVSQGGFSKVAVVDTGVDPTHPDLKGLVLQGKNTIDDSTNTMDDNGHGTLVAGVISAYTNNGEGVASVSFKAYILPVKALNKDGVGTYADVAEGIVYSADAGARIVNLSLGGTSDSLTLKRAVEYALERGSILVASAGNSGDNTPFYPASYEGVLSISASDQNDNLASFSSYGENIFVSAPGVSIYSTSAGGGYSQGSGTSFSAPHVSGLLALIFSKYSEISNNEAIETIKNTADKVGPYPYDQNGWNQYFGYGRVNAGKALESLVEKELTPTPTSTPTPTPTQALVSTPTPTLTPTPTSASERKEYKKYTFKFELEGVIREKKIEEGKILVEVKGGNLEGIKKVIGEVVEVYFANDLKIKFRGEEVGKEELTVGSQVNIKGKYESGKLIAEEIIVQKRREGKILENKESGLKNQEGSSFNVKEGRDDVKRMNEKSRYGIERGKGRKR